MSIKFSFWLWSQRKRRDDKKKNLNWKMTLISLDIVINKLKKSLQKNIPLAIKEINNALNITKIRK